jgi:hypothetical protein
MSKVPKIGVGPAQRPRNGFDRSETHIYSQPAGMLLPVMQMFLNPHDNVSVDTTSIVQAQTLQGRPFLGMKQNFAFYFVPARLMYSYSKAFFSGLVPKNTLTSSALSSVALANGVRLKAPSFRPYEVFCRFAGIPLPDGSLADSKILNVTSAGLPMSNINGTHYHSGDGGRFGTRSSVPLSEVEKLVASGGADYIKRPFGQILRRPSGAFDIFGYDLLPSYVRFCDMMKYGAMPYVGESVNVNAVTADMVNYEANLFYWLAYQKIYQDHFLDTNYEKVNPRSYNVDDLLDPNNGKCTFSFSSSSASLDRALDIFSPRYVKYEKDLLSNIHPSPLFVDDVSSTIRTFVGTSGEMLNGTPMKSYNMTNSSDTAVMSDRNGVYTTVSAAQLRNLFAFDKMQQITSRAPKTYKAQMLAHYGVNVADDLTESFYVGGFNKALEVSPVIATADGTAKDSSTNFGQQGSYIDSSQDGHINFTAKEHGVLMCLSWFSPNSLYDADGLDAFNAKFAREDYFVPEAEDLGMQPIEFSRLLPPWIKNSEYRLPEVDGSVGQYYGAHADEVAKAYDVDYKGKALDYSAFRGSVLGRIVPMFDTSRVYGWQPRYHEFKAGADYLHGEFKVGRSMQILSIHRPTPFNYYMGLNNRKFGQTFGIPPVKFDYNGVPASFLFVDPACTNDVVEVNFDGTEKTDPFRITTHFAVSYITDMSVSGLPRL